MPGLFAVQCRCSFATRVGVILDFPAVCASVFITEQKYKGVEQMSFTQKLRRNIKVCDGCDRQCKLGISVETEQEAKEATRSVNRFRNSVGFGDNLPYMRFAYPEIGGVRITDYYDQNGNYEIVSFDAGLLEQDDPLASKAYENQILDATRKIAKCCDRYKQPTPNASPQNNDTMIQVRLYDYLDNSYCNLGTPVSMGCALKLMGRLRDVPRPADICLDDKIPNRFIGLRAELVDYYPGRFSDHATGVFSLIAPFRYTCTKCKMDAENHSRNMEKCADCIVSGKCRDEFMRQTVGATLFPELYATKNQKQR